MNMKKLHDVVFVVRDRRIYFSDPDKEVVPRKKPKLEPQCKEIKAHKVILANQSDVFEAMFYGCGTKMAIETNSDGLQVVKIEDIGPDVFQFMIDCMYGNPTTNFKMTEDNLEKVAYSAEKYNFENLRNKCGDFMNRELAIGNCIHFRAIAKKYHIKGIRRKALKLASSDVDHAFSSSACVYADVDMWKHVLSTEKLHYTSFSEILNNAIYWATSCQGCHSMDSVREVLKPLQPLLKKHCTYELHDMYTVFFPDLKTRKNPVATDSRPNPAKTSCQKKCVRS